MFRKKYVTKEQFTEALQKLNLVDDVTFYDQFNGVSLDKSNRWYQNLGGKCLDEVVDRLDNDDNDIDDKIELLLEHLGLKIENGKRIVKIKKGKK